MKLCLVSTYPPSKGNLAEYGAEVAHNLSERKEIEELIVLANKNSNAPKFELQGETKVERCWERDSPFFLMSLLRSVSKWEPDIVYFNQHMMSWGSNRVVNFLGSLAPLLVKKICNVKTVVTLHNLGECVDLSEIPGISSSTLNLTAMRIATNLILGADAVTVTLDRFKKALERNRSKSNVFTVLHGTWEIKEFRELAHDKRILAFGFWGPTKDLELLIEAYKGLSAEDKEVDLTIAGRSHPNFPGYVEKIKKNYSELDIEFTGYVPEEDVEEVFFRANVVVLPYKTATGASGVLNLSKSYGRPVVAAEIGELRETVEREGGEVLFYRTGNKEDLEAKLRKVLNDKELQRKMAEKNYISSKDKTFEEVSIRLVKLFSKVLDDETL
ncbi:MAG: glycosyltransferase [Candidatus Aenigmatarchaeota archaeon]